MNGGRFEDGDFSPTAEGENTGARSGVLSIADTSYERTSRKPAWGNPSGGVELILDALCAELNEKPSVVEQVRLDLGRPASREKP